MGSAPDNGSVLTISSALEAEIRAAAAIAHRPADEIVREALEIYLARQPPHASPAPDARERAEAVARMRERRKRHPLPPGVTIEDIIAWGREGRA